MTIPKSYEALAADLASEKILSKTLIGQKEAYMMLADQLKLDLATWKQKACEAAEREASLLVKLDEWLASHVKVSGEKAALQQRLTVAERRAGDLEQMLSDVPHIHFEGCDFQGFNSDGSEPFELTDGPVKKIKSIRLIGWRCEGPRMSEEGITVKDKLAIAEKELADLHAEIKVACKPPHGDYWHQSLYEAEKKVADVKAALKPAEEGEGS